MLPAAQGQRPSPPLDEPFGELSPAGRDNWSVIRVSAVFCLLRKD